MGQFLFLTSQWQPYYHRIPSTDIPSRDLGFLQCLGNCKISRHQWHILPVYLQPQVAPEVPSIVAHQVVPFGMVVQSVAYPVWTSWHYWYKNGLHHRTASKVRHMKTW